MASQTTAPARTQIATKEALKRGFSQRCPACGEGKMLHRYIKPLKECMHCHQPFGPLRADDGPAWATILITGHLSMPFVFWLLDQNLNNTFLETLYSILFILILSALILPRAKGVFMAIIWLMHVQRSEKIQDAASEASSE